jgi:acetylornithine deacetylase/succinyl-diaminopimelate desuccinylase-like protein
MHRALIAFATLGAVAAPVVAQPASPIYRPGQLTQHQAKAREIYAQLIAIKSGVTTGSITLASRAMADRFREAGIPEQDIFVGGPQPEKHNVVARIRAKAGASGLKPLLLLAHLDVVEALKEDWSPELDPYSLTEKDGYFYGRGTVDDKAMAAIFVANVFRMRQEGFAPDRDIIIALTADEESGKFNGVEWLLQNQPAWMDAGLVINEGSIGRLREGKYLRHGIEAAQKITTNFALRVTNRGGHSSVPLPDNAINTLARALLRLEGYQFPVKLSEVTREYFTQTARIESPEMARAINAMLANPADSVAVGTVSANLGNNAVLRTTCVATMLKGGHATNALPQLAEANINCRLYPTETAAEVRDALAARVADTTVQVVILTQRPSTPTAPLLPEIMEPVRRITRDLFGDIPVIPEMASGGTDSRWFRSLGVPAYGISGMFLDLEVPNGVHGRDERLLVRSFYEAHEFLYRLTKALSVTSKPTP